jgi:putative ABC transport system ATP-binding protein
VTAAILELERISKNYLQGNSQLNILTSLDLRVALRETVAIVGESGSGKSTLLSLMAGFDRPDAGQIKWSDQDALSWDDRAWSHFRKARLGFVFQNYHLIPYLTAQENVALPLKLNAKTSDPLKSAEALLVQLGLGKRLSHLPTQLSGGECQRVAMARALIHEPSLVLADEPTGSLDVKTGQGVLNVFFELLKQKHQTAIIVTHSHEVAARCDRVLTLNQGKLWPA